MKKETKTCTNCGKTLIKGCWIPGIEWICPAYLTKELGYHDMIPFGEELEVRIEKSFEIDDEPGFW
jgi:hypothetical protein